jgi:hypothetical protein
MIEKRAKLPELSSMKTDPLPPLGKNETHAPPPTSDASKVDIKELTWSDKERVLRVLFAKMNGLLISGNDSQPAKDNREFGQKVDVDAQTEPQRYHYEAGLGGRMMRTTERDVDANDLAHDGFASFEFSTESKPLPHNELNEDNAEFPHATR